MTSAQKGFAIALVPLALVLGGVAWYLSPSGKSFRLERADLVALSRESERNPNDGLVWFHFGSRLRAKGAQTEAVGALQRALELRPNDNRARVELAWALLDSNETNLAFQLARAAENREPSSTAPKVLLARLYQRTGAYHKAEEQWKAVLQREPRDSRAWYFLAFCHLQMQHVAQATECIERAVELAPRDSRVRGLRGSIAAAIGDMPGARAAFESAITLAPADPRSHHDLANFLLSQSRTPDDVRRAEQAVAELTRLQPDYPLIVWHRARIAAARKDWAGAVKGLETTLRVEPALDEAYFHLANAYHRLGKKAAGERAMAEFRRRSELTRRMDEIRIRMAISDDADLRFRLASLQRQAGQLRQARESVQQGLQLAPDSPRGKDELRAIERAERRTASSRGTS